MRVHVRGAVVLAAAGGLLLLGTGAASAGTGAKDPLLAGYTLVVPDGATIDATFVVPTVDCSAAPDSSLFLGAAFDGATAAGQDATVGVIATCTGGVASYEVGSGYGDVTSGFGASEGVAPGTQVELLLEAAGGGYEQLDAIANGDAYQALVVESASATVTQGGSTRSVGAPSPAFAPVTFTSSFDGAPLAAASPAKSRQGGTGHMNVLSVTKLKGSAFRVLYRPAG